jgi:hypothetical protein
MARPVIPPVIPTGAEVEARRRQWAEATALSLALLEASIKRDSPSLSEDELRLKLIERLDQFRRLKWSGSGETLPHGSGNG